MELLGIGPLELLFIIVILIIVVGPRDISKVARTLGRMLNKLYRSEEWRALTRASRSLRTLPNRLAREAQLEELEALSKDLDAIGGEVNQEVRALDEGMRAWAKPAPARPPETIPSPPLEGDEPAQGKAPQQDEE